MHAQASDSIGWFRAGGGGLGVNMPEPPGRPFSPAGHALARVLWLHYISKARLISPCLHLLQACRQTCFLVYLHAQAYEFVDTLIMVLKKKEGQISFL